jgi:hypothetical protein
LSSAILYLAIVAIWAIVLVPRWLRPRAAQPQPADQPAEHPLEAPQPATAEPTEPPLSVEPPQPVDAEQPGPAPAWEGDAAPEPVPAGPSPTARQAEILQARRRMLAMLVVLTAGAVGIAVTGIAATWVVIPPAVLLAGFLVLLREAARIDAERQRRATRIRRAALDHVVGQEPESFRADAGATPDQVPATAAAPVTASALEAAEPLPGAEVIDISGRISDQVYDQYSDAADRAVGD